MSNLKITPYGKNILIEPMIKSQIAVSDSAPLCEYGKVVAVGGDVTTVKEGETIGFTVYGLNELFAEDKKYYFVPEDSRFILGKLEW